MVVTGVPFVKNRLTTAARSRGDKPGADQSRTRSRSDRAGLRWHAARAMPARVVKTNGLMLMANADSKRTVRRPSLFRKAKHPLGWSGFKRMIRRYGDHI